MQPEHHLNVANILTQEELCVFNAIAHNELFKWFVARRKVSEYLNTPLGAIVFDLTALAAVEFALVRVVCMSDQPVISVPLPLPVIPQDARLALVGYDTTDTKPCETAQRILNGDIRPQDLFLFTGDLQKYKLLVEPNYQSLEEGLAALPELVSKRLNAAGSLAKDLLEGAWAEFQQLIWRLRLLVMIEAKEHASKEEAMRGAIRSFLNRWDSTYKLRRMLSPDPFAPSDPLESPIKGRGPFLPLR